MDAIKLITAAGSIFIHPRPEGWFVIGLIVLLTAIAFGRLLGIVLHLRAEERALASCHSHLSSIIATERPVHQSDIDEWVQAPPNDGLVDKAIKSIWAARHLPNPDLDAIGTMLAQSEAARLEGIRGTPNRLLLLGLLGTVAGLAGVVGTLGPQIEGTLRTEAPLILTRNLGVTIQHMQNAFACTAWGILAAVLVAWQTSYVAAKQSNFLAKVQAFGLEHLSPVVFPRGTEAQIVELREVVTQGRDFMEQVASIMTDAGDRFNSVLTDAGSSMAESVKKLEGVALTMQDSLLQASAGVQGSAASLKSSAQDLQVHHGQLRSAYAELLELFETSKSELSRQASEQLSKIGELQYEFGKAASSILDRLDVTSTGVGEATKEFSAVGERFQTAGLELKQRLSQGFDAISENMNDALKGNAQQMNRVDEVLRLVGDRLTELTERWHPSLLPSADWEAVRAALTGSAEEIARIRTEHASMSHVLSQLSDLLAKYSESGTDSNTQLTDPTDLLSQFQDIRTALVDLNPRNELSQIRSDLEDVQETLNRGVRIRLFPLQGRRRG